jgi:FixJ family two-component response regulator
MTEHTVLFVDDEENILNALKRVLRRENYRIITAASGPEGLKILEDHQVQVVISDQRMPEMSGTEFLTHVMERHPDAVRIILSGYTDVDTITDAINQGHIYKFLLKPWNEDALKLEISRALDYYELVNLNKSLHQRVLEQNEELKRYNETLEDMIKNRTLELEIQNQVLELSREILENIPAPVIGISEDGIVVLANGAASRLSFDGRRMTVGEDFADYFPESIREVFRESLIGKALSGVTDYAIGEEHFDIDMSPLSGKENRAGVILLFKRKEPCNSGLNHQ